MKSGIKLGWSPAVFWAATISEFFDAIAAFNEMHGDADGSPGAPSDDEMTRLLERYG